MDRFVNQDGMDFQKNTVQIDLVFTAGTSGAVPSTFTYSDGISGVTLSTNDYIVALQDNYVALLDGYGFVIQNSFSTSGACRVAVSASAVTSATAPTITITPYKGSDGTAIHLATGDELHFTFRLKR